MVHASIERRTYWLNVMHKIAYPVLINLSHKTLKKNMPVQGKTADRPCFTYLEALARTLAGIAPWLETGQSDGKEGQLRKIYCDLARASIDSATDPDSPDFLNFSDKYGEQPVVDGAFLAHAIVRAPNQLWRSLDNRVKTNLVNALKSTRKCIAHSSNWLLFAAMIETALKVMGEEYDKMRVDYAIRQHEQWYLGDGMYGDGPQFHYDYYNSFVIQPMLVDILENMPQDFRDWPQIKQRVIDRAVRYASIQEKLISPEGTFPAIGRSIAYRLGVFQHLCQMALQHRLDSGIKPAQVRCGLTRVIERMLAFDTMFDENGWLKVGFCGSQPNLGEFYISTGSLYLCTTVFLPLGLPAGDEFWSGQDEDWSGKKIWNGENINADHAMGCKY